MMVAAGIVGVAWATEEIEWGKCKHNALTPMEMRLEIRAENARCLEYDREIHYQEGIRRADSISMARDCWPTIEEYDEIRLREIRGAVRQCLHNFNREKYPNYEININTGYTQKDNGFTHDHVGRVVDRNITNIRIVDR